MKKRIMAAMVAALTIALAADACTSAIVSGKLTANGRPLMWKNRDTNDLNNRVERIVAHDGLMEFVALFDARDLQDTAAWMGFNEAGSTEMTRTRAVRLSYASRKRQSSNFGHDISKTPDKAITMGISTMLSAKRIISSASNNSSYVLTLFDFINERPSSTSASKDANDSSGSS